MGSGFPLFAGAASQKIKKFELCVFRKQLKLKYNNFFIISKRVKVAFILNLQLYINTLPYSINHKNNQM